MLASSTRKVLLIIAVLSCSFGKHIYSDAPEEISENIPKRPYILRTTFLMGMTILGGALSIKKGCFKIATTAYLFGFTIAAMSEFYGINIRYFYVKPTKYHYINSTLTPNLFADNIIY